MINYLLPQSLVTRYTLHSAPGCYRSYAESGSEITYSDTSIIRCGNSSFLTLHHQNFLVLPTYLIAILPGFLADGFCGRESIFKYSYSFSGMTSGFRPTRRVRPLNQDRWCMRGSARYRLQLTQYIYTVTRGTVHKAPPHGRTCPERED